MLITGLVLFFCSLFFLLLIRLLAIKIGLVDKPNKRKQHQGRIPLVGGIATFCSLLLYLVYYWQQLQHPAIYFICATMLVITGIIDDRFDLSIKIRVTIQTIVAVIMMFGAGIYLHNFGAIISNTPIQLGYSGYFITLCAIWAAINAFNMIDGLDGLLGGLSIISFAALALLFYSKDNLIQANFCLAIVIILIPFMLLNLSIFGERYKIFMGDAGSTLIGFTLIWVLLQNSQQQSPVLYPVTSLWIIAIPLMDMVATVLRRLRQGSSPFAADRQHIHYILINAGFSTRQTVAIILVKAVVLAVIGLFAEFYGFISEKIMMLSFLSIFALYCLSPKYLGYLARRCKFSRG